VAFPDGPFGTWSGPLGFVFVLCLRAAWWFWRRARGRPVPFLGRAITRLSDGIAAFVLLANTSAGWMMRAQLAEARNRRQAIQLEERDKIIAASLMLLAEKGISRTDLESHAGSVESSVWLGELITPTPLTPNLPPLPPSTSPKRATIRRSRRSGGSETP